MMKPVRLPWSFLLFFALFPVAGVLRAQVLCNQPSTNLFIGGEARSGATDAVDFPARWFVIQETVRGRSYSAIVDAGSSNLNFYDPFLGVYWGDGSTLIVSNDDTISQEPAGSYLSRANWIATQSNAGVTCLQVSGTPGLFSIRVVETTMFCPWWFVAGDYNAFSIVRNTTNTPIHSVWTWRAVTADQVATTSVTIGPNETLILNARDFVGSASINGSIDIAHDGPLDGLIGSTTTLSASTGLSFDSQFGRRPIF